MLAFVKELTITQGLVEYSIGREEHPSPDDPQRKWHLHVYFCTEKKQRVKNPSKHFMWKDKKGDYQAVGTKKSFKDIAPAEQRQYAIDYTMKDGDFIQHLNADGAGKTDAGPEKRAIEVAKEEGADAGLDVLAEHDPKGFLKGFNNARAALEWVTSRKEFDVHDYRRDVEPLNVNESPCWVVYGQWRLRRRKNKVGKGVLGCSWI